MVRRTFLRLIAASTSLFALSGRIALGQANDRGIGGTGTPGFTEGENQDRGIGGTGVIGTIRRFGSIVVNGLRITYPKDVAVRIDGQTARVSQLKIGQVVRVVAERHNGVYSTRAIDVSSEVVGFVDSASANHLTVLGQDVFVNAARGHTWAPGDHVAVSGLRRPDGVIVASLVERRSGNAEQIAGPVIQASDGALKIGDLRLMGVESAMIGQRALFRGKFVDGAFSVTETHDELADLRSSVNQLVVESYVANDDGGLRTGSGFAIGGDGGAVPLGRTVRAVITTTFGNGGALHIDSLHVEPQSDTGEGNPGRSFGPNEHGDPSGPHGFGDAPGGSWPGGRPGGNMQPGGGPNGPGGFGGPGGPGGPPGFGPPGMGPGGPGGGPGGPGGPRR